MLPIRIIPMKKIKLFGCLLLMITLSMMGCEKEKPADPLLDEAMATEKAKDNKLVVYQMMTRLFGNTNTTNKLWGTLEDNGVGKFNDVNEKALQELKDLGVTHVWYTGVIEHAVCTDYRKYKIHLDDADVVKGRAGSPYAIKDYYDVNPDMAVNVNKRKEEFMSLVDRTHKQGLKVLIDFIPNHVARYYKSDAKPKGVKDFGATDNTKKDFDPQNNFYYIPNKPFKVPGDYTPLGGTKFPTSDKKFKEMPAKVSGNGAVTDQPSVNDWFETVRLNYGVNHVGDGSKHFDPVPSTWEKCRDVLSYWTKQGVDGFRCDMAEMVPVEFWGWVIPQIQKINPEIIFIAEIYNPMAYKDYIFNGKFDYLYDKVGMYDSLRSVMEHRENATAQNFTKTWKSLDGINNNMLRFLENHDEQRIASKEFSGTPLAGIPGMAVSATLNSGPIMVYFGQEVGEPGAGESGFSGDDGRTTIFDYWGVPEHQKWVNEHKYDGALLSDEQKSLRAFYKKLLHTVTENEVFKTGKLYDLQPHNLSNPAYNADMVYAFVRYSDKQKVLVVCNFNKTAELVKLVIPSALLSEMGIEEDKLRGIDLLTGSSVPFNLDEATDEGVSLDLPAYSAQLYELK